MNTVKKWLSDLKAEMPMFAQLCRTIGTLVRKSIRKEDITADKAQTIALQKQTVKSQLVVGTCVVLLLFAVFRGCSRGAPLESGIIHADGDLRKFLMEQQAAQQKQDAERRERERVADEQRKAEEVKMEADEKHRAQKHEELGAWYRSERKRLEERKKDELSKLEKAKNNRAHDILVEHNWPQIKFPFLDDIIIAELLPEKYRSYALTECPITIKDIPIFTSMRIDGAQVDGIVDGIRLEGRVPMTVETAIDWMQKLSRKLDAAWSIKHMNLGKDQIFPDGGHEIAGRSWEGLPEWHALFQCQVHKTDDGQIAKFTLDIDSYDLPRLVREQLDKEYWKSVEKFEADFKTQEERLGNELHRRQNEVR